jgi:hypothetical protein
MTLFWSALTGASDSTKQRDLEAHRELVTLTVGRIPMTCTMVNVVALSQQDPSVVAALKNAGLTAEQEQAYRTALIRVLFAQLAKIYAGSVTETSALGQNLAFGKTHEAEFKMLANTGVWAVQ